MEYYDFHPDRISLLGVEYLNKSSVYFFNFLLDGHPALVSAFINNYPAIDGKKEEEIAKDCYALLSKSDLHYFQPYELPFSYAAFKRPFKSYLKEFGVSQKTAFIAIHYAVAVLLDKDLSKVRYIYFHTHGYLKDFTQARRDFARYKLILTVRDPRAALWSYKQGFQFPFYANSWEVPFFYRKYSKAVDQRNLLVVRHEDLHLRFPATRARVCRFLGIGDDTAIHEATVFGKPWDGSYKKGVFSRDGIRSSKPSPAFVKDDWKRGLTTVELWLTQTLLRKYMKQFHYPAYKRKGGQTLKPEPRYKELIEHLFVFLHSEKQTAALVRAYNRISRVPVLGTIARLMIHLLGIAFTCYILVKVQREYWKYSRQQ